MLSFRRVIYSVQVSQSSIFLYTLSGQQEREQYILLVDISTLCHQVPILLLSLLKAPVSWHGLLLGGVWCGCVVEPCCRMWCAGKLGQRQCGGCMRACLWGHRACVIDTRNNLPEQGSATGIRLCQSLWWVWRQMHNLRMPVTRYKVQKDWFQCSDTTHSFLFGRV